VFNSDAAEPRSAAWLVARIGAAAILSAATLTSASAGSVIDLTCVVGARNFNCAAQIATAGDPYIRTVPEAVGEVQKAQIAARDRKWAAHCHPVIERDSYGVAHYHY
jgi:hypothetical protein